MVSRVDMKYKRMNSTDRVRILNPGSVTIPRPEGEFTEDEEKTSSGVKLHELAVWPG